MNVAAQIDSPHQYPFGIASVASVASVAIGEIKRQVSADEPLSFVVDVNDARKVDAPRVFEGPSSAKGLRAARLSTHPSPARECLRSGQDETWRRCRAQLCRGSGHRREEVSNGGLDP